MQKADISDMKPAPSINVPWRWPAPWVHALCVIALLVWATLECFGLLPSKAIAAATFDQMQQHRLWASAPDSRILIVDIDERSLADMASEFGRWPWPRDTLATLLENAQARGAKAVVFDILFSDPDRLHPGGDRALEVAVRRSKASFFPVVRLPPALDAQSDLRANQLPGLAAASAPGVTTPRVALILPFMEAMVESGRLGTHTAQLDSDGKIRRYSFFEPLTNGWSLRSMPAAVALESGNAVVSRDTTERLIVWRRHAEAYPRVPFSIAWQCAEGRQRSDCPDLAGRILIIGATASSLHDLKATPLAPQHTGVDILATLTDNALHQRSLGEVPASLRWLITVAALWVAWSVVRRGGADATSRTLWGLPLLLLAIGFASLHSERLYVDLSLPATAVLTFLSAVKLHDMLRRHLFGLRSGEPAGPRAVTCRGPSGQAELIERTVCDIAARSHLSVTGTRTVSGEIGTAHSVWTIWRLPDLRSAAAVEDALRRALPQAICQGFPVGVEPQRDLFLTMTRTVSSPALGESPTLDMESDLET